MTLQFNVAIQHICYAAHFITFNLAGDKKTTIEMSFLLYIAIFYLVMLKC